MNTEPVENIEATSSAPLTRDKERTKAAILSAAASLFNEHGPSASLAEISKAAGVSKSGLLHHFSSKDALIEAIVKAAISDFYNEILRNVDPLDLAPGRRLRAYVKALTNDNSDVVSFISPTGLVSKFDPTPALTALMESDSMRWREFFESDRVPLSTIVVVRAAAETLAVDRGTMWLSEEEFAAGREYLLQLTHA